jgi:acid stress-induced BolA-like protein IbaG/YrbA
MEPMTKKNLESVLAKRLKLDRPHFRLEKHGRKWSGSIISPSFRGANDLKRQREIWNALNDAFGPESTHKVGMLLAYTPEEWDLPLEGSNGKH